MYRELLERRFSSGIFQAAVGYSVRSVARLALHGLAATRPFFEERRLLMMSHSAADRSVSLLVEREGADRLAHILHAELVVGEGADE